MVVDLSSAAMNRNLGVLARLVLGDVDLGTLGNEGIVADKVGGITISGISVELVTSVGCHKGGESHLVLGQSSGLVRTNDSDAAQSLDCRKSANDGVHRGHLGDSPSISQRNDGSKTLWNHGNGTHQSNGDGVDGVESSDEESHQESNDGTNDDKDCNVGGDSVNLTLHVSFLLSDLVDKSVDVTDLGMVSRRDDETKTAALRNHGGGESHVLAVTKRNLIWIFGLNLADYLLDRDRLSGESSLGAGHVEHVKHTNVSWKPITKVHYDDVAWNDFTSRDLHIFAITNDFGVAGEHSLKGIGGLLGRTFLYTRNRRKR